MVMFGTQNARRQQRPALMPGPYGPLGGCRRGGSTWLSVRQRRGAFSSVDALIRRSRSGLSTGTTTLPRLIWSPPQLPSITSPPVPDRAIWRVRGLRPRQWWWPWRPSVYTGVAPGRVHCGTGRLVGPQVATPSASERENQPA